MILAAIVLAALLGLWMILAIRSLESAIADMAAGDAVRTGAILRVANALSDLHAGVALAQFAERVQKIKAAPAFPLAPQAPPVHWELLRKNEQGEWQQYGFARPDTGEFKRAWDTGNLAVRDTAGQIHLGVQ